MSLLRTQLDNGLDVLIQELHTAPVVTFWVWYRVGSRNEHSGITGISHWVEHMLFRGTERWPASAADQAISRQGGMSNGMTWYDFTTFYATLPAGKLGLALDIEADRMQNARFEPADVEAERSIIISERQGSENSPMFLLEEEISAAAFRVHPYGHETIGHLCDLQSLRCADLHSHYRTYYQPANALITVAGDLKAGETMRLIERFFADIPTEREIEPVRAVEPAQRGERRVCVEGGGQTDYIEIAYHIPQATHPDFYALTVLNAILAGGSGFLIGRGGVTNHTSRLYRALVDHDLAIDIAGNLTPTVDPNLLRFAATVHPQHDARDVETALLAEIERLQDDPVESRELEKAVRQARALFAYASESITHQGFWLGFSSIFADYSWYTNYLENLAQVTAEQVQRVAQVYLTPRNRTVGWYLADERRASGGTE